MAYELTTVDHFRLDCERFMEKYKIKPTNFSKDFAYTPVFVTRLRKGLNVTGRIMDRVRVNMEAYKSEQRRLAKPKTRRLRTKRPDAA